MLSMVQLLEKLAEEHAAVIVGAGWAGEKLARRLLRKNIQIKFFFDNEKKLQGKWMYGIQIVAPRKLDNPRTVYIISVSEAYRSELYQQLLQLGIEKSLILEVDVFHGDWEYHATLREDEYKDAISDFFYFRFGREMNWNSPKTYNEKINWDKLNARDSIKTRLADKYLVREWVKEQIGAQYLTELYGVWENAEQIDFDVLPEQFVLKLNHASTYVIVVKDKKQVHRAEIVRQLNDWKNRNFAYLSLELQYRDIFPRILCEEYLPGVADTVYEYQFYCFHGKPLYIWCINGSHTPGCKASFYDHDWNMLPFGYGYPVDPVPAPRPKKLEKMWELSEKLSQSFQHVRVDWYHLPDGRILFGEMTFSTWGGGMHFSPPEYDEIWGKLI